MEEGRSKREERGLMAEVGGLRKEMAEG